MNRLNTDQEIAAVVAQFVPVKIDVDTQEYALWQREHPSDGNTIPKLFVVRADDETLYGRSGALNGRDLPDMLVRALQNSGRILSPRDAAALIEAADQFETLKQSGDIAKAVRAINRIGKIGQPGKIPSYAESASRVNELVNTTVDEIKLRMGELATQIEGDDIELRLAAIMEFLEFKRNFGALKIVKSELSAFQKKYTTKEYSQLAREARVIDTAIAANSRSKKTRAIEKLRELVDKSEFDAVQALAESTIEILEESQEDD